jgi:predicted PurR-regulated permease PerM
MEKTISRWSSQTKLIVSLLVIALGIYLFYRFRAVINPVVLAVILAYILYPVVNWMQARLGIHRALATGLVYLFLIIIIVTIPLVIIPPLTAQSEGLNLDIQRFLSEMEALFSNQYVIAGQTIDMEDVFRQAIVSVQGLLEPFIGQTIDLVFEVISSLAWVVFILVVSFYLVKDANSLHRWLESTVPQGFLEDYIRLRSEINLIWSSFFRGQIVLVLVVTVIITIVGLIIGLPFAMAMGVLAGLLEFFPSIGNTIWAIIAALLALFAGSTWLPIPNWMFMVLVIVLHAFYGQFVINYLIPRIIGRRVKLPPVVIIIGIVAGALLAGVLGILLAAPTIASARVIGRYIFANLFDQDPFPDASSVELPPPNPRWWRKTSVDLEEIEN